MITREDLPKTANEKFTEENFYIFVQDLKYKGRKSIPEDVIIPVKIFVKGAIAKPNFPLLLECKKEDGYIILREETEVFKTFEECKNFYQKDLDNIDNFILSHLKDEVETTKYELKQSAIKQAQARKNLREFSEILFPNNSPNE